MLSVESLQLVPDEIESAAERLYDETRMQTVPIVAVPTVLAPSSASPGERTSEPKLIQDAQFG